MNEDQRPRKKYNHIQKALLIEWLKELLPEPVSGNKRQGWRRLPVGEWAKKLDVSRKTLYLWLRALEVAGYIQVETFYRGSPKRLTKAKATMSLIENSPEDIAKIRLKNFSYISEHKEKELAAYKYIASELARGESEAVMMDAAGALDALYAIPQWVVWKYGSLDRETRKPKKVLLSAKPSANNAYARCDDPLTWTNYAQAQDRLEASHLWKVPLQGVAFALNKNGIVMLDLDHCIHDGMIDAWAQDIIDAINSYTEVSPSGEGIRIIAYGSIPAGINRNGVEMYDCSKFMSITGMHLSGTPTTIEHRQEQINAL